jgi:hypothetical protein
MDKNIMERKTVYTVTIEVLIKVMQAHKKTGRLQTDLSSGVPGFREPCLVEIALEAGNVISCSISGRQGPLLTGAKAYQELTRQGQLDWTFVPQTQPLTASTPITDSLSIVPKRVTNPQAKPVPSAPITGPLSIIPTRVINPQTKPVPSAPTTDSQSIIPTRVINPQTRHTISRPRRIVALTQWQMRPWRDMHKQVYSLADGKKSVTEIAVLLSTTPEAIKEVLHDLQSIRVVALE